MTAAELHALRDESCRLQQEALEARRRASEATERYRKAVQVLYDARQDSGGC